MTGPESPWSQFAVRDVLLDHFSGPSPTCDERNIRGSEWGVLKTTCSTWDYGWDWTRHKVLPLSFWGKARLVVRKGDSIITKAGPRHRVGVPAYVSEIPSRILPSGKMLCLRPDTRKIEPAFLALSLADRRTQEFLDQRTTGMAESQVNFENADLLQAPIWLPHLSEQRRIVQVLSDTDGLIKSITQLLIKKQAIKQGMMQQLLTGKTRLPGFTAEWHPRRLSQLLSYEQPGPFLVRTSQQLGSGRTPVLTAGKTFVLGYTNEPDGIYTTHPVIIFDDFTTSSKYVDFDFKAKSSAMKILSARAGVNLRFVYERMQLIDFPLGDHKRYWISEYSNQVLSVPSENEQNAIATVLRDCSEEIDSLEHQLDKAKATRQGMMQELLTGRTRLPAQELA